MRKSLIALGLTTILALGTVSTAFAQKTVSTEQNCGGEKCKKKKKKKKSCNKKESTESSTETETKGVITK